MKWPSFRRGTRRNRLRADLSGHLPEQGHRLRPETEPRRWGWLILGVSLVTLMGGLSQSPRLLRRMGTFRVRQVEVRGTRYLAPDEVLQVSGVGEQSSVFDSPDAWIAALEGHAMVASARVERRLPSTVRIVITETRPVALVRVRTLVAVDGTGRVLPIAPEAARLDLPIMIGAVEVDAQGMIADPDARAAVVALDRLQGEEPALAAAVSEFAGGGALRLLLRVGGPTHVVLPLEPSATRLNEMRRTLDDLATRGELQRVRLVEGRYEGQVVVSLNSAGSI